MGNLEFGLYDTFPVTDMAASPVAADVYERHLWEVQLAEELGYRYFFTIEHQNSHVGMITAPNVYLSALAQRTSRIRFGVMIYQLPLHHPLRLAQETAMLDHLSRGRLEFGCGVGVAEHEFMRWDVPFAQRRGMAQEALELIVKAWTEDEVTYQGEHWKFDEALPMPKPYQQPHPPIWMAAHSPETLKQAARNNYNVSQNLDVDSVIAEKFNIYRKAWRECEHSGSMPRAFLTRAVHVAETDAIAQEEAEKALLRSHPVTREQIAQTRIGFRGNEDTPVTRELGRVFQGMSASYDFWIDNGLALVGSPETVTRRLKEQRDLIGHDIFCANHRFGPIAEELSLKSLKLFAQEVMPAFT